MTQKVQAVQYASTMSSFNAVRQLIACNRFMEILAILHFVLWFFFVAYSTVLFAFVRQRKQQIYESNEVIINFKM